MIKFEFQKNFENHFFHDAVPEDAEESLSGHHWIRIQPTKEVKHVMLAEWQQMSNKKTSKKFRLFLIAAREPSLITAWIVCCKNVVFISWMMDDITCSQFVFCDILFLLWQSNYLQLSINFSVLVDENDLLICSPAPPLCQHQRIKHTPPSCIPQHGHL